MTDSPFLRKLFHILNHSFMVPVFRLGLGGLLVNPYAGYIMVLKTVGRKSGKLRFSPVNYAILDGCVYCLAGFGKVSLWYRNLEARPDIELILPGRALAGHAETVEGPEERLRALRAVLLAAGLAGYGLGVNPRSATDAQLLEKAGDLPVVRVRPTGIGAGPADHGGWLWISVNALALLVVAAVVAHWWLTR